MEGAAKGEILLLRAPDEQAEEGCVGVLRDGGHPPPLRRLRKPRIVHTGNIGSVDRRCQERGVLDRRHRRTVAYI